MNTKQTVRVTDLPPVIAQWVRTIFRDQTVKVTTERVTSFASSNGTRALRAISPSREAYPTRVECGSWGGANPFERRAVDLDREGWQVQPGQWGASWSEGGKKVRLRLHFHPDDLPTPAPVVGEASIVGRRERCALLLFSTLTPRARKPELEKLDPTGDLVQRLVDGRLLARNKAGAVRLTAEGTVAAENSSHLRWELAREFGVWL